MRLRALASAIVLAALPIALATIVARGGERAPIDLWHDVPDWGWTPVSDYEKVVRGLGEGDVVRFPGKKEFKLGRFLGSGARTRVYELADQPGRAIRIPAKEESMEDIGRTLAGYEELRKSGLPIVKVHEGARHQFAIVDQLPDEMLLFDKMVHGDGISPELRAQMRESFLRFMDEASTFTRIGDLHFRQIGYLPSKGSWILFDWHDGNFRTPFQGHSTEVAESFFDFASRSTFGKKHWSSEDLGWLRELEKDTLASIETLKKKDPGVVRCVADGLGALFGLFRR